MARPNQVLTIATVILCFMSTEMRAAIADGGPEAPQASRSASTVDTAATLALTDLVADSAEGTPVAGAAGPGRLRIPDNLFTAAVPAERTADPFAQRGYGRRGRDRNDGARAAIILGAVATITGTAVLVYANRPDCSTSPTPGGCGYGTKVVGSAVLSAGVVALLVGALTWR